MTREELIQECIEIIEATAIYENNENPLRFSAPKEEGLYLIGSTHFNPFTKEEIYLVKVGISTNLYKRMKTYVTHNPMMFHIDYITDIATKGISEWSCHKLLHQICESKMEKCDEWFKVTRELYLEICEKGFKFFLHNA